MGYNFQFNFTSKKAMIIESLTCIPYFQVFPMISNNSTSPFAFFFFSFIE